MALKGVKGSPVIQLSDDMKRGASGAAASSPSEKKAKVSAQVPSKEKKGKTTSAPTAEPSRRSAREKKAPASYSEDAIIHAQEERHEEEIKQGLRYRAPMDPPGMKSTAYLCKYPCGTQFHGNDDLRCIFCVCPREFS